MKSPFDFKNSANNRLRTNNYDWSCAINTTFDIGRITPFFCDLVPASGSLSFNPRLGLQFMPMVFPNQTRMYARVSFFKVPLRALWEDYMDFVGNYREGLVEPYHDFNGQCPATGSLYDYLGLPTTTSGFSAEEVYINMTDSHDFPATSVDPAYDAASSVQSLWALMKTKECDPANFKYTTFNEATDCAFIHETLDCTRAEYKPSYIRLNFHRSMNGLPIGDTGSYQSFVENTVIGFYDGSNLPLCVFRLTSSNTNFVQSGDNGYLDVYLPDSLSLDVFRGIEQILIGTYKGSDFYLSNKYDKFSSIDMSFDMMQSTIIDITPETSPYYDSSSKNAAKQLKISAYAARAYEAIYNAFIRDNRNNPYYVDGEIQYNRWIPSRAGGVDTFKYQLHYCNWEKDAFTTAVQSPQQGIAPLVGITTYSDVQSNADGTVTTVNRVALVDEDGRKFGVQFTSDSEGLKDVAYTELSADQPVQAARSLMDLVNSGISINDLRNVNAYQKFLELNMRQGYSYRDIIQGRFNVKVRYDELLMPEYLGGFSEEINMQAVVQTVQRNDTGAYADQLGAMAGNAGVRRDGKRVSVFCDEESIVMGIVYVVPVPIYTQVLPKHFLYRGLLDHFQPEFANIGFQPITYRELCPIEAYKISPDKLYDTFGYNRPWYEYCQKLDTAHGQFRTTLRNFIMNRTFAEVPELSRQFLVVDPNQVNDVFAVTDATDKIFGQIYLDVSAKLPISRDARPMLD